MFGIMAYRHQVQAAKCQERLDIWRKISGRTFKCGPWIWTV